MYLGYIHRDIHLYNATWRIYLTATISNIECVPLSLQNHERIEIIGIIELIGILGILTWWQYADTS